MNARGLRGGDVAVLLARDKPRSLLVGKERGSRGCSRLTGLYDLGVRQSNFREEELKFVLGEKVGGVC